jgi:hypothetical protein
VCCFLVHCAALRVAHTPSLLFTSKLYSELLELYRYSVRPH